MPSGDSIVSPEPPAPRKSGRVVNIISPPRPVKSLRRRSRSSDSTSACSHRRSRRRPAGA